METSARHSNPRARGGRDHAITALSASIVISIHAPAWGATQFGVMRGRIATIFQSTRPRGARRSLPWNCCGTSVISIHAPAWGATRKFVGLSGVADISIHAPAWGATSNRRTSSPYAAISIHAPAWGATWPPWDCGRCPGFQSTRPRGARLSRSGDGRSFCRFQSTRPRGARRAAHHRQAGRSLISIHAPAWGATRHNAFCRRLVSISIHAPAWGATVPVYTGLITEVTLYFSRTSFLAVLLQAFFVAKSSV